MKSISNEVKVGIIAIITIVIFIWLYNFLKGKNLLNKDATYYSVYQKVGGLAESSPIEVNGYRVGVVQSISFIDPASGRLLVQFSVDKDFRIPKNTVAEIIPVSLLGGMKVQFVYGDGPGFHQFNDTIPGRLAESLTDMLETELIPVKNRILNLIVELDSVMSSINEVMNATFKKDLGNTMANLNNTTKNIDDIIDSKEGDLKTMVESLSKFSAMLSENTQKMSNTFSNLQSISDTLAAADIFSTVANLKASLEKTAVLVDNLNEGEGTAGKLLTNDSLYVNLNQSLQNLSLLLEDLKNNPKRYVQFSVFGRKDQTEK